VDYLLPEITPYATMVYLYLLRNSFVKNGAAEVRVGKRTIATGCGKGWKEEKITFKTVTKALKLLEENECIKIGDTNKNGTLYIINLPKDIPLVAEKMANLLPQDTEEDYFNNPEKRREIFERDKWFCRYCGEKLTTENTTLDHFTPQSKGGKHNRENLRTCCLICNSIKSGKTYEEAAPLLLKSSQERKVRSHK